MSEDEYKPSKYITYRRESDWGNVSFNVPIPRTDQEKEYTGWTIEKILNFK